MTSRAALLLAAVAALAGCSIDLEGAACEVPGATDQCPDGQRCGKDLRCSKRAAEDSCAFCDLDAKACQAGNALGTCVAVDEVCNGWTAEPCAGSLVCPDGATACRCAAPGAEVAVDPERSGDGDLEPTGAAQPPGCRLDSLQGALAVPDVATIRVYGRSMDDAVVIGRDTPLALPAGVTLTTDGEDEARFVIEATGSMPAGSAVVRIAPGAGLDGFTVRSTKALGAGSAGVLVDCAGAPGTATLSRVVIAGGGLVERALSIEGTCGLSATGLDASGATADGIYADLTGAPLPELLLAGGAVHGNDGSGIRLRGGKLTMTGTEVAANAVHGVHAQLLDAGHPLDLTLAGVDVHDNAGTGLFLKDLADAPGSSASVTGSRFRRNSGAHDDSIFGSGRRAGGLLLWGAALPGFALRGNLVCSNGGDTADDVGIYSSTSPAWSVSGEAGACATGANVLWDTYGTGGRLVYSTDAAHPAEARYNSWPTEPPASNAYFNATVTSPCPIVTSAPEGCD